MQARGGKNGRYRNDQGGFACLEALLKRTGRPGRSRTREQRQSQSLPERRGGRNNKYKANKCNTMHDMAVCCARGGLMQHYTSQTERKLSRDVFPAPDSYRYMDPEEKVPCLQCCGPVTGMWMAYSDLLDFSDQLSCRKLFHLSYGLLYINF